MKILVITGCLGLIGSHITRKCLERNWIVYGIDILTYAANLNFLEEFKKNKNFIFSKEDICDVKFLPDCDYVINIAAESHVGNSIIDSKEFTKTNILGVQNLLELVRHKPSNVSEKPIFLHFSTDEVYGDIVDGFHKETDILKPSNPYSASKAAADMLVLAWSRTYNLDYVIVRPTNNYGYGQYPEKLIPLTVKLLQRNKKIRLHDEGKPIRNWLHSDDTAEAVLKIIDSNVRNEIYNISGNFEQTNKDTVEKIIKSYLNSNNIDFSNYIDLSYRRPGQDVRYAIDDSKLKNIGWQPKKVFDDEIYNIVNYYKNNMKL
jgi:dTDP-glucose 4,6-dehydratase